MEYTISIYFKVNIKNIKLIIFILYNHSDINIYQATVPDRMHHLNLGLFCYQIKYTKELLQSKDNSLIDEMDRRLAAIPRHPGLKIFKKGLQSIAQMTAKEYRNLMKVMVFIIDGLYDENLIEVYVRWNEMYVMSRLEVFKENDLKNFQVNLQLNLYGQTYLN